MHPSIHPSIQTDRQTDRQRQTNTHTTHTHTHTYGFNQPSPMSHNIIFRTESDLLIRSRYVLYFMFSLTFKVFVMFVTFLLFQSNLYVVLARGKGPKNSVHRDLSRLRFIRLKVRGLAFSLTDFSKCLKNVIFPKCLVNTLIHTYRQTDIHA